MMYSMGTADVATLTRETIMTSDNPTVAYRFVSKSVADYDNNRNVACLPCGDDPNRDASHRRAIVLRSETGRHISHGSVRCMFCRTTIRP